MDILSKVSDIIQSEAVLQKQVHWNVVINVVTFLRGKIATVQIYTRYLKRSGAYNFIFTVSNFRPLCLRH